MSHGYVKLNNQYEAVALFIERALAVNHTFTVTNENVGTRRIELSLCRFASLDEFTASRASAL